MPSPTESDYSVVMSLLLSNGLEATLSDSKRKYIDKVNALLAAWEHVTNYIANTPETTQALIEWANEHTLELVLRGEWPKLAPALKTHLNVTLQRCASQLTKQQQHQAARRCQALIVLVQNPWGKPALDRILNGQLNPDHEEEEFCCQEKGELLKMRLKILCEDRCEDIAVYLAAACVRSLRRNDRLRSISEPGQVNYMVDVYIVLLYKLKRTHDIVAQLKLMDLKDGLEMMQRLSGEKPTKYGTARVWRNSSKAAELVAQYLVTTGMVRPLAEVGPATLEQILNSWALLHAKSKDVVATLPGIIRKLIEPAESAQHIYIFCGVLARHFGDVIKSLVVELYIRALTTDMNELENQKSKSNKEKVVETAQRLSQEFLKLADCVSDSVSIARECVLTAFSLHPTRACYDRIRDLAVACGKIQAEVKLEKEELPEEETTLTMEETLVEEAVKGSDEIATKTTAVNEGGLVVLEGERMETTDEVTVASEESRTKDDSTSQSGATDDKSKCHSQRDIVPVKSDEPSLQKVTAPTVPFDKVKEIKKECEEETTRTSTPNAESNQGALILIKGHAVTGSANYDERAVPQQVLDGDRLGISAQLCDDLAVVLSSQRYHVLTWWLDWKELSELCERYLENAEEMRNTNKELKYLNIDYSQFKDQPYEDERDGMFYGIEKGYEQWDDSDFSESDLLHQSTNANRGTSNVHRSLDDSSDTDSENVGRKRGRPRKVPRLESSESEYDIRHRKPRQRFRKALISSSESDTNTQDSQTDSLGSDGFKKGSKKIPKRPCNGAKKVIKRRPRKTKLTVDSVSHFQLLVNENIRPSGVDGVSDNSNSDIMTLFSADMDENKRETIKGSAAFNAAQLIISEKRSDPEVIKSLRMFRPNSKKLVQINEKISDAVVVVKTNNNNNNNNNINNGVSKKKENSKPGQNAGNKPGSKSSKFAPMLSTLNLNPKIALRRVDEIDKKLNIQHKKQQAVTAGDLSNEIRNIQKTITFTTNKNPLTAFQKQRTLIRKPGQRKTLPSKSIKSSMKSKLQELLTKNVPGMGSMEFSVPPRVRPTVQVVQVTRNISQSPNSTASGNTPPRSRSTIQLPGTPSSGGHDSGVGMSPAGQTPPPPTRSSSLQDVGEEANQPPDTSPGLVESTNTSTMDSNDGPRTVALAVLANQRITSNQSPKKSPSPSTNNTGEQQLVLCKPDGTYQLVSPSIVSGQRGILSLQNYEDGNIAFARQVPIASVTTGDTKTSQPQTSRNAGLPKFQQAFGKTICTLSTESTTVPSSSTADETPAAPAGAATNVQRAKLVAASNISKAVQTAGQNSGIANIPNLQVATGTTRQILNIVQSTANSSGANAAGQTLQLSGTPGVIYAHKIPGATPGTQLISIPANLASNRQNLQVKLNIIRTPFRSASGGAAAIQVLTSRLPQQQTQQQQQQQQTVRQADPLINSTMEMPNQVSSSTLEQLREFESVLEQVKERSTSSNQSSSTDATTSPQTQTQTAQSSTTTVKQTQQQQPAQQQVAVNTLTQQLLMSSQSPSNAVEFSNNGNATVAFQQQQQQQEVTYPQKVAVMYANQNNGSATPKVVNSSTPVVVVTSYCQPAASPALSVTSQSSSSPCVTPAPTPISSTGKTQSQSAPKTAKKAAPKAVKQQVNTQSAASKTPPIPKPQQKPQEDPETTQRIYAILGQYAEQLRNSPDLNNKPAPRRRSNPPTNPNQSSKRKKSSSSKSKTPSGQQTSEPSPSADDMGRTMGSSEDSSGGCGIGTSSSTGNGSAMMHVQDSPSGFSVSEETLNNSNNNSQSAANDNATHGNVTETRTASATSDSNDSVETNVKRRNLIFAEPNTGQARTVIVQEALQPTSVGEALASKMTTGTAVLVSGTNFMLPMNFVKSGQQITVVSGGSKLLAAVPSVRTSGGAAGAVSNAFVLQSLLSQANKVIQQQQQQQQQPKQVKLSQQSQIIIPQSVGSVVRFASEDNGDNIKAAADIKAEPTTVATSKPAALGLFQHSGVITSNPNLSQRLFNSSSIKLPSVVKQEPCEEKVATAATTTTTSMTLAFSSSSSSCTGNDSDVVGQTPKEPKEAEAMTGHVEDEKLMISPKAIKRKDADTLGIVANALVQCNARAEPTPQPPNRAKPKVTTSPVPVLIPTTTTTASSSLDTTTQYLVSGGPSSGSDSQESAASSSAIQNSAIESSSLDGTVKVENGVLCGNARLQEAWEPERKGSPDTPWRYIPTTNALGMEPLKVYSRDAENSETIHNSVLQIINKGQGIEMSSSGVFQTKKYYHTMNNSIDAFPKFPGGNKSLASKVSVPPNNARAQAEHENQQRLNERKQQMLERELRLQKSLSEECEDLGVDEPSTSDLFPEADLLFDTKYSPAFDHSSQEASCSQSLSGPTTLSSMKSYSGTGSFFKSLDSVSSDSRDTSPVVMATTVVPPPEPSTTTTTKKKAPVQRRAAKPKESQAKKNKKSMDSMQLSDSLNPAKRLRLSLVGNLSQDEASNSNSDLSRLSPMESDPLKETSNQKTASRNGSKDREGTPSSSRSSFQSHVKLELDADSSSAATANTTASSNVIVAPTAVSQRDGSGVVVVANNISSTASSAEEDENLTLLDDSAASARIASPLSPIAGPLLMSHRYTYANNKKRPTTVKQSRTSDFFSVDTRTNTMSWESPLSDRTRSSTDDEDEEVVDGDESSISESLSSSQLDNNETIGNGLQEVLRSVASVKVTPVDHATYSAKRKTAVNRKTTTNHKDSNVGVLNKSQDGKSGPAKKSKVAAAVVAATLSLTASETESSSPAPSADKLFDMVNPSDDDTIMGGSSATLVETTITTNTTAAAATEHCTTSSSSSSSAARRSSLRGHVKKGCACCNGSPERPAKTKKAPPVKPNQQQQEQQQQQHPQQQQLTTLVNSKVKKTTVKQQQQQQAKQLAKKR